MSPAIWGSGVCPKQRYHCRPTTTEQIGSTRHPYFLRGGQNPKAWSVPGDQNYENSKTFRLEIFLLIKAGPQARVAAAAGAGGAGGM